MALLAGTTSTMDARSSLSMDFAVKAIDFVDKIEGHYSLKNQFERSSTSIGANIAESQRAQSTADFVAKMKVALKEANETQYWLKLLYETKYLSDREYVSLHSDLLEMAEKF